MLFHLCRVKSEKYSLSIVFFFMKMSRFGEENQDAIKKEVQDLIPDNTKKSKTSIWKQFLEFCNEKSYNIHEKLLVEAVSSINESDMHILLGYIKCN